MSTPMSTQFGLAHVWVQGDFITRSVAVFLLGMSVLTWVLIVLKSLNILKYRRQSQVIKTFWDSTSFEESLNQLPQQESPFRLLAQEGYEASAHHQDAQAHLHSSFDLSDWVTRCLRKSIDESTAHLQSGLAVLASIGSTAPFIGLFGTVWGIYHALLGIGSSGQASMDQVAGPVGEALIMTALGLAVAIPAVLGYNALVRGNKGIVHQLNGFAHDLHAYFVTGARVQSPQSVQKNAPQTPLQHIR